MQDEVIQVNGKTVRISVPRCHSRKTPASFYRLIYDSFSKIGIEEKYIAIEEPKKHGYGMTMDNSVRITWYVNGSKHHYVSKSQPSVVDNLSVVSKVIEMDCYAIRNGLKSFGMVMNQYLLEQHSIRTPRQVLGIDDTMSDKDYIKFKYTQLIKQHHPDAGGDAERFKEVQAAYEALKKELSIP